MNDYINIKIQTIEEFFMIQRQTLVSAILLFMLLATAFSISGKSIEKPLANDELDEQQTQTDTVKYIFQNNPKAQSFTPTLGNYTRIQLLLSKKGTVDFNLTVSIRKSLISNIIVTKNVAYTEITTEQQWIQINLTSLIVEPEETYFIICSTNGGDINNSFQWHSSNSDVYNRGLSFFSQNDGVTWFEDNSSDFCFKTFGKELIFQDKLEIQYITSGFGTQINYGIKNVGKTTIQKVNVFMKIEGGLILTGDQYSEELTKLNLDPGETANRFFFPVFGLGVGSIVLDAWTENSEQVSLNKENAIFLPFFIYIRPY